MRPVVILKSYVRGHFEKRNGRVFYVRPYENNKSKHPRSDVIGNGTIGNNISGIGRYRHGKDDPNSNHNHFVNVDPHNDEGINYVVEFALELAYTIHGFEDGEIVKARDILDYCKSILSYYKYMDESIKYLFSIPNAEQIDLDSRDIRLIRARRREAEKLYLRVSNSKIKRILKDIVDGIRKIA